MSRDTARAAGQFFGGRVCLDFANTVDWRTSEVAQELIPDYAALLSWSERRCTMSKAALRRLRRGAAAREGEAAGALLEAHVLRTEIWAAADALRDGRAVELDGINRRLSTMPSQPRLARFAGGYLHALDGNDLGQVLWPVLWSLTASLTSADAHRIGCCQALGCGWFFVDESPNRSRLWCSSELCGNRERARRAYAKRRAPT